MRNTPSLIYPASCRTFLLLLAVIALIGAGCSKDASSAKVIPGAVFSKPLSADVSVVESMDGNSIITICQEWNPGSQKLELAESLAGRTRFGIRTQVTTQPDGESGKAWVFTVYEAALPPNELNLDEKDFSPSGYLVSILYPNAHQRSHIGMTP